MDLDGIAREEAVKNELKNYFKPEFLNRLDDTIIFNPLNEDNLISIVDIMFKDLQEILLGRGIRATLSTEAKKIIATAGFDIVYGARPLRRALYELVEDKIADMILSDELESGDEIRINTRDEKIVVEKF
jgi:hypothetical protein